MVKAGWGRTWVTYAVAALMGPLTVVTGLGAAGPAAAALKSRDVVQADPAIRPFGPVGGERHPPEIRSESDGSTFPTTTWQEGACDDTTQMVTNTGAQTTIMVEPQPITGTQYTGSWISEADLADGLWGQVGYHQTDRTAAPVMFAQIWNLAGNALVGYFTSPTPLATGYHTFSMFWVGGTTWDFAVDGDVEYSYGLGAPMYAHPSAGPGPCAIQEQNSFVPGPPAPIQSVEFSAAIDLDRSGAWQPVEAADAYEWARNGAVNAGVIGNAQDCHLGSNQLLVGSSYPSLSGPVWNAVSPACIVGMAPTPAGNGYWMASTTGGMYAFGDAGFYGSMASHPLDEPMVGFAATPTGRGYWEVAADGGIFAFGDAPFYGSMGGRPLDAPIVALAGGPTGQGYWEVAADGGIFAFGGAPFDGSMGGRPLDAPIVAVAGGPTGQGYWEVAADGGIFAFGGAPFDGSLAY
jgi:hypothetical protein